MKPNLQKILLFGFFSLFLVNLLILDFQIFIKKPKKNPENSTLRPLSIERKPSPFPSLMEIKKGDTCPSACLQLISQATHSSFLVSQPSPTLKPQGSIVKEIYVPLGSGSTDSTDWVELPGVESFIDTTKYPSIQSVIFEALLRIPTGNGRVYAKLYNITDKHDAWNSEVYLEGREARRVEANNVVLAPGNKLYRVMLKSTMGCQAFLDFARVKILLE